MFYMLYSTVTYVMSRRVLSTILIANQALFSDSRGILTQLYFSNAQLFPAVRNTSTGVSL
uniref:Uncharacterized protein n=1 Tax=Arundo donax TaxID=35708 RepID=A0A0A9A6D8_ARUDO